MEESTEGGVRVDAMVRPGGKLIDIKVNSWYDTETNNRIIQLMVMFAPSSVIKDVEPGRIEIPCDQIISKVLPLRGYCDIEDVAKGLIEMAKALDA